MYRGKGGGAFSLNKGMLKGLKREKEGNSGDPAWFGEIRLRIKAGKIVLRGCSSSEAVAWSTAQGAQLRIEGAAYNVSPELKSYAEWREQLCASICKHRSTGSAEILILRGAKTSGDETYPCGHGPVSFPKAGAVGDEATLVTRINLAEHPTTNHEESAADLVIAVLHNLHQYP